MPTYNLLTTHIRVIINTFLCSDSFLDPRTLPADFIVGKAYTNFLNNVPFTQILSVREDGRVLRNWREARNIFVRMACCTLVFLFTKNSFKIVFFKPISPIARPGPGPSP